MASDAAIKSRLLIQFDQIQQLETSHPQEVRCVGELISEGVLIGCVQDAASGSKFAKIDRLTKFGQSKLEGLRTISKNGSGSSKVMGVSESVQVENDRVFDETIIKLSSAGLGVQLSLLPLLSKMTVKIEWCLFLCYCIAATLFGLCAVVLLVSHKTSSTAFSRLSKADKVGAMRFSNITGCLNWVAFSTFLIATICITCFICFLAHKVMKVGG